MKTRKNEEAKTYANLTRKRLIQIKNEISINVRKVPHVQKSQQLEF